MDMLSSLATAAGLSRPKKKFLFNVTFCLQDLLNTTYVSGLLFAKVKLRDGRTFNELSERCEVKNHSVKWDQSFQFPCKMYASPQTGELEPCICKVSVRKETKGGKSYKKLGYVKINLAEYAGAGETKRKYLLESYNEHKHRPDNSILKVKISLMQTSGDVLFKAPRAPVWELEDEGIQQDMHHPERGRGGPFDNRLSTLSTTSSVSGGNGSLQDVRRRGSSQQDGGGGRKASSAGNLRTHSTSEAVGSSSGGSEPASKESISEEEQGSSSTSTEGRTPRNLSPRLSDLRTDLHSRSNSLGGDSTPSEVTTTGFNSLPGISHRRHTSLGVLGQGPATVGGGSPLRQHRRQQSLVSGQSSKSTSAYSTLSERSTGSWEDGESMGGSTRSRLSLLPPSARVEQSRVNAQSVIEQLFQNHDLLATEEGEEDRGGLKIYVDKSAGTATVTGHDLRFSNLKPVDMKRAVGGSPKARHRSSSSSSKDSTGTLRASDVKAASLLGEGRNGGIHHRQHSDSSKR